MLQLLFAKKLANDVHRGILLTTILHLCVLDLATSLYPLSDVLSNERFSASHKVFLAAITIASEPKNFSEAMQDARWIDVVGNEITSLELHNTWTLEDLPDGKRPLVINGSFVLNTVLMAPSNVTKQD